MNTLSLDGAVPARNVDGNPSVKTLCELTKQLSIVLENSSKESPDNHRNYLAARNKLLEECCSIAGKRLVVTDDLAIPYHAISPIFLLGHRLNNLTEAAMNMSAKERVEYEVSERASLVYHEILDECEVIAQKVQSLQAMDILAKQAQDLNMGY